MRLFTRRAVPILVIAALLFAGCGSRFPSPKTSHRVIEKHFHKYGNKYKESDFGKYPLEKVEIVGVQEMQKKMATAEAYIYLSGGPLYWVRVTLQKKTFGWRSVAWETLGIREQ